MATSTQPPNVDAPIVDAALVTQPSMLAMQRAPEVVLEEAAKAAQALRNVIESKPAKVVINGKTYLQFEDWQTLGRFYGVTAAARSTTYLEEGRVRGYEAHADAILVSTGVVISSAQGMCLDDESKWNDKPMFQLRSMAQTRACAKALRNVLAWVVVLAGYAPTPVEEMDEQARTVQAVSGGSVASSVVGNWCQKIGQARNYAELQATFRSAYQEASATRDQRAQAAYIAAKDQRRRDLR